MTRRSHYSHPETAHPFVSRLVTNRSVTNRSVVNRSVGIGLAIAASTLAATFATLPTRLSTAHAQAITDEDVLNYARAVYDMEPERVEAYETASDILTSADSELSILEIPLRCTATRLSDMPNIPRADRLALRTVLVEFCNQASQLAEANDLTPKRFNSITAAHQEDPELAERIQAAMSDL